MVGMQNHVSTFYLFIYLFIYLFLFFIFFSILVFFYNHSQITGLLGNGEGISLTPHYHFRSLYRHLVISRAITAESSPLHIGSSRFPSTSCLSLSYAPQARFIYLRLLIRSHIFTITTVECVSVHSISLLFYIPHLK